VRATGCGLAERAVALQADQQRNPARIELDIPDGFS
jgi:hypothetical protein